MLLVSTIREEKERVIAGLSKKRFSNPAPTLDKVIELDDLRKSLQLERDNLQSEANLLSKQIGEMMKTGQKEQAQTLKDRTAEIKITSKNLSEKLDET